MKNRIITFYQNSAKKTILGLSLFIAYSGSVWAQVDLKTNQKDSDSTNMFEMSIEELMSMKIVSASRNEEKAFDAPVSSFVITKSEISAMNATSIPDALRTAPGLIVREVSNGNYDVSIRGGVDGLPSYNYSPLNTTILVMIDNRPVFSSLQGGTFWQNLPVGLVDIERIEIVNGPSSPLYGPNAVSGVINIITSHPKDDKLYVSGQAQGGNNAVIGSFLIGKKFNKFSVDGSFNYDYRTRQDETFYDKKRKTYVPLDSTFSWIVTPRNTQAIIDAKITDNKLRYADLGLSLNKMGANLDFGYDVNDKVKFTLSNSFNKNTSLMPANFGLQMNNFTNESFSTYLRGTVYGFNIQASVLDGNQGLTGEYKPNIYHYRNTDLYLDYNLNLLNKKLSLRPALSLQSLYVNDKKNTVDVGQTGQFNGESTINNYAASLKIEATPINKLRIIGAIRYDQFNYPDKGFLSYQGTVNYKLNDKNVLRFVTGKSYNGSFLVPTLMKSTLVAAGQDFGSISGSSNLNLLNNTMYEVGFRTNVIPNVIIDIAAFNNLYKDFNNVALVSLTQVVKLPFPPFNVVGANNYNYQFINLPVSAHQNGITISAQTSFLNNKLTFKPNLTIQQTTFENYSPYYNIKDAYKGGNSAFGITASVPGHLDSTWTTKENTTPSLFGGFNLIYTPIQKLTLDLSGYAYNTYRQHSSTENDNQTGFFKLDDNTSKIREKLVLNLNVSYKITHQLVANIGLKNMLNNKSAETFASDRLGLLLQAGLKYNY